MGGVPHTCLDFRLFDKVNKLDDTCLKDLCVKKKPLGLMFSLGVSTAVTPFFSAFLSLNR